MVKQNRKMILLVFVIIIISTGLAVWQNYEWRMANKNVKLHITQEVAHGAYFLYMTKSSIDSFHKENYWDDVEQRDSFIIWLAYAAQSLSGANSTMNDFISHVSYQDRAIMGDISEWYFQWYIETIRILNKPGQITEQEKERISELSNVISKVDGFYVKHKSNDLTGILGSFAQLHTEWRNVIEERHVQH